MKYSTLIFIVLYTCILTACSNRKLDEKGFQVSTVSEYDNNDDENGINRDSLKFDIRPGSVLLTGNSDVRLTTIYKVNINKRDNTIFIGTNNFHYREVSENNIGNNWNGNLMPGIEAVYGYNMVNVSYYNIKENQQKNFFEKPVLIKTLYYPSFSKDTLNNKPVTRKYIIVSVYNDDTNKDGFINPKDLRRLYLFNIEGERQKALVPENYSVIKSEYDPDNDYMLVYAQSDINENGKQDETEPIHIFWIDLKDPFKSGRLF